MKSRPRQRPGKIIFITGTDTGVGKTVFTALFLHHLRKTGTRAMAMKPFCSGGRGDVRLLRAMQDRELSEDEINPFYFPEAVAPLISTRQRKCVIPLSDVVRRIKVIATRCERLLVEGSGGLFVPLGKGYFVMDVIQRLHCEVVVVARNRLGTINHTLLSVAALKNLGIKPSMIALINTSDVNDCDPSCRANKRILSELLAPIPVRGLGFLGKKANEYRVLEKKYKKVKKTLARFCQ